MKKADAISILATSVRPREAKDRARYDVAVKMAIEALKCSETPKSSERPAESAQNVQNGDLIQRKAAIEAINGMIDRFERLLADIRESKVDDSVCGMCEYDGAFVGQSGDWCNECPGFEKDDCFRLSDECRKRWLESVELPAAQPEKRTNKRTETHSCDSIDRQAAIDAIENAFDRETILNRFVRKIAISAVRKLPSAQQEPCEDAVSRKMAMDAITASTPYCVVPDDYHISVVDMEFRISTLPSVTPKQRTGHWIEYRCDMYICSECDNVYTDLSGERYGMNYCPNCGARMTEEDV